MVDISPAAQKLKQLREQTGLSIAGLAAELGMGTTTYRHYENRFKRRYLPIDLVRNLTPVLVRHGIDTAEITALAGTVIIDQPSVMVIGAVEADACIEYQDWPPERQYSLTLPRAAKYRVAAGGFAVEVRDKSCDRAYDEDSVLICARPETLGRGLRFGDRVVADIASDGKVERRCMTVTVTPEGDIVLTSLTSDKPLQTTAMIHRGPASPDGLRDGQALYGRPSSIDPAAEIPYEPREDDNALIIGMVIGAITLG